MYCILIAGMPASGKSTIANYLSEQLHIPMISKDSIKELLFDEVGFQSRAEKNKLGRASMKIMYYIARQLMQTKQAFILENNFENISKEELMQLLEEYQYIAITVRLTGDPEKIYKRFAERDRSPERHRGHVVNDCYPEKEEKQENPTMLSYEGFLYGLEHRGYNHFNANGSCIEVDTTDFDNIDKEEVLYKITQQINEIS